MVYAYERQNQARVLLDRDLRDLSLSVRCSDRPCERQDSVLTAGTYQLRNGWECTERLSADGIKVWEGHECVVVQISFFGTDSSDFLSKFILDIGIQGELQEKFWFCYERLSAA